MGADIHAYVEYSDFVTAEGEDYWSALTKNFGDRNYYLFGLLAEVRGRGPAVFDPRGLPPGRLSYQTEGDYWLYVTDDKSMADHEGWTLRDRAERWVRDGSSIADMRDGKMIRVSDPDSHSHSWLATEELAEVLDAYALGVQSVWPDQKAEAPVEWQAVLAAMRVFESNGKKARVVFWFDN